MLFYAQWSTALPGVVSLVIWAWLAKYNRQGVFADDP